MRFAPLSVGCLAALVLAAPASAAQSTVIVGDNFFKDATVRIQPGDSVRWNWAGVDTHTVTADADQTERFASPQQTSGSFTHVFSKRGRFTYFCEIHPVEMKGTVEVGSAPFPDTRLPRVARARAKTRGRSATIRFRLSEAARVRLRLRGPSRRTVTRRLGKGSRALRVRGLRPGRYRATVTATDAAGNKSRRAASTRFRIRS